MVQKKMEPNTELYESSYLNDRPAQVFIMIYPEFE